MTRVIYHQANGEQMRLDVANGTNLMAAATSAGLGGIVGDCDLPRCRGRRVHRPAPAMQ